MWAVLLLRHTLPGPAGVRWVGKASKATTADAELQPGIPSENKAVARAITLHSAFGVSVH